MANVVMKKGLYANLPSSAEENVLFFCTDTGRLFQGAGTGKALIEYSNVLGGYVDLADLKAKNPSLVNKLYLTNDSKLYVYDGTDYVGISGSGGSSHDHLNKDVLDKFSVSTGGTLLFDGKDIIGIALTDYMTKTEYASSQAGVVLKSEVANEVNGVRSAQPLMYYGTDSQGNIGFHYIPVSTGTGNQGGSFEQRIILNTIANKDYHIDSHNDLSETKCLIQAYKFVAGGQDIIKTVKEFNNANESNFYYNKETVNFDDTKSSIKGEYKYNLTQHNSTNYYTTGVIKKSDFVKINSMYFGG